MTRKDIQAVFKPQSTEEMSVAAWLRGKKVLL